MPINGLSQSDFVGDKKEIKVPYNEGELTLYVQELGFVEVQNKISAAVTTGRNTIAALVAEVVSDKDGNKFTYEEVCNLKKKVAMPLFKAVSQALGVNGDEKN